MENQLHKPTPSEQSEDRGAPTARKPFVLPQLRCEAELPKLTAGRFFTLSTDPDPS